MLDDRSSSVTVSYFEISEGRDASSLLATKVAASSGQIFSRRFPTPLYRLGVRREYYFDAFILETKEAISMIFTMCDIYRRYLLYLWWPLWRGNGNWFSNQFVKLRIHLCREICRRV